MGWLRHDRTDPYIETNSLLIKFDWRIVKLQTFSPCQAILHVYNNMIFDQYQTLHLQSVRKINLSIQSHKHLGLFLVENQFLNGQIIVVITHF